MPGPATSSSSRRRCSVRRRLRDDGALVTERLAFPHHTAIVARVRKRGPKPVLVILHQNAGVEGGDNKVVQEWTIDLAEKREGTVTAYRPVADRPAGPSREEPPAKPSWDWTTASPESQGMSPTALESAWAVLKDRHTTAFLVIRHDRIVFERYAPGYGRTKPHYTASMAKALVGGVGLMVAMSDGRIRPDDPASRYVPQWRDDPKRQEITVRHLATHTSGIEDAEEDGLPHDRLDRLEGGLLEAPAAAARPVHPRQGPGTRARRPRHQGALQQPRHGDARLLRDGEPPGHGRCGPPLPPEAPDHGTAGRARCGVVGGLRHRDDRGRPAPGGHLGRRLLQPGRRGQGRSAPPAPGDVGRPSSCSPRPSWTRRSSTAACRAIRGWGGG